MFGRNRARTPRPADMVIATTEIVEDGAPANLVVRFSDHWVFMSADSGESELVGLHFAHLRDADTSLWFLRLKPSQYAMRIDIVSPWHVHGPLGDEEIERRLATGFMDEQYDAMVCAAEAAAGR